MNYALIILGLVLIKTALTPNSIHKTSWILADFAMFVIGGLCLIAGLK